MSYLKIALLILMLGLGLTMYAQAQTTTLPDVATETILLDPAFPVVGQPVTITVQVRNVGSTTVTGRRVYIYVDPTDQPPLTTTEATKPFVVGLPWPAGDAMIATYGNFTINQPGRHVIYAWIDPLERITETDELNNLQKLEVDVLTSTNQVDAFEPNDTCAQAKEIIPDGTVQSHNFNAAIPFDEDWVKFQAQARTFYTITVAGEGSEARPNFEVWPNCDKSDPFHDGELTQLFYLSHQNAPTYLRLVNNSSAYSANNMSYRLTVEGLGQKKPGLSPTIMEVNPKVTTNNQPTQVVMQGQSLAIHSLIQLCLTNNSFCSNECVGVGWQLAPLTTGNENGDKQVNALVQANLRPGNYCAAVTNLSNSNMTVLTNALTIKTADPTVMQFLPTTAANDAPTTLHLYGQRLYTNDLTITLGSTALTNLAEIASDGTHITAQLPANLPTGEYPIKIMYGSGESVTLPTRFAVIGSPHVYLPLLVKSPPPPELPTPTPTLIPSPTPTPIPMITLYIQSDNTGGINQVEIRDPNNNNELLLSCGPIGNNTVQRCGQFKVINFYKIVAVTQRCGTLQANKSTEHPGGDETRRVYCNR